MDTWQGRTKTRARAARARSLSLDPVHVGGDTNKPLDSAEGFLRTLSNFFAREAVERRAYPGQRKSLSDSTPKKPYGDQQNPARLGFRGLGFRNQRVSTETYLYLHLEGRPTCSTADNALQVRGPLVCNEHTAASSYKYIYIYIYIYMYVCVCVCVNVYIYIYIYIYIQTN